MESDTQQLVKELERLGLTPADITGPYAWTAKALNPASNAGPVVDGIPDHEAADSLKMHWRQVFDISSGSLPTALGPNATWELDMLMFEGPAILGAYQIRESGNPANFFNGWITNANYNFFNAASPLGPKTVAAVGPDSGTLLIDQQSQFQQDFVQYRALYAGHTMHFDAAALTNQGRLVAGQSSNAWSTKGWSGTSSIPIPGAGGDTLVSVTAASAGIMSWGNAFVTGPTGQLQSTIVPTYENTLQTSIASATWTSKDGFYIPLRYENPNLSYKGTMQSQPASTYKLYHPWGAANTGDFIPSQVGGTQYYPYPHATNMRAGTACIKGIAPTTTLSLKSLVGFELTVPPGTGYSALLTKTAEPSNAAVERYFVLRRQLEDVYPAKYNDKELLQKIINGIGTTVGDILPEGKWKSLVSMLTPMVSGAVGMATGKGGNKRIQSIQSAKDLEEKIDAAPVSSNGTRRFGGGARGGGSQGGKAKRGAGGRGKPRGGPVGRVVGGAKRGLQAVGSLIRK